MASAGEEVTQYINLGKAFYENPTTQSEAVAEFRKALDLKPDSVREQLNYALSLLRAAKTPEAIALLQKVQKEDPKLPHTWFNLGIYYKRDGQFDKAIEQLDGMTKLVPSEPVTHYNLGSIYKLQNKTDLARKEFEASRDLDPALAAPHFQLFNIYRQAGQMEQANRELALFRERKKAQENDAIPKEDVEWCEYAEIYEPLVPEPDHSKAPVAFAFASSQLAGTAEGASGLIALDAFGTGGADLLVYSAVGVDLYKSGKEKVAHSGLDGLRDVISVTSGDFNNDGLADLCILTASGPVLYENKHGSFAKASVTLPAGEFSKAIWIDFDHDYDLDLVLLGKKSVLLRNQGAEGFVLHPFPFVEGEAVDGVAFRMVADTKSKDLLVTYKDRPATLYRDNLTAQYAPQRVTEIPAGAAHLSALDLDNDGNLDIAFVDASKEGRPTEKVARNQRTGFASPVDIGPAEGTFADFANRGFADYISGGSIRQNVGDLQFLSEKEIAKNPATSWVAADFNGDGLVDLAAITEAHKVEFFTNKTATKNRLAAGKNRWHQELEGAACRRDRSQGGQQLSEAGLPGFAGSFRPRRAPDCRHRANHMAERSHSERDETGREQEPRLQRGAAPFRILSADFHLEWRRISIRDGCVGGRAARRYVR